MAYDSVRYFEDVQLTAKENSVAIPDIFYAAYQNIIAINHFKNEAYIFCHSYDSTDNCEEIIQLLNVRSFATYTFNRDGEVASNLEDAHYKEHVRLAKTHCQRGDVFQLVLSRRFSQNFKGDEFNVYRALRSINPSPYLFFFDYGDFKIFGSSPEAQLIVKDQYFSHVIHLVSKVTGIKKPDTPTLKIVADTFPAGTLSGAPKHRAMQLIEEIEKTSRGYYGGAILVAASDPEAELQETYNKLGALNKALEIAEKI